MEEEKLDTQRIMKILDHPVRIRIIELLGSRGPLPWKDLAQELGIGTGALYYHIDTLENLVTRDASKRYALTKSGRVVFSHLGEKLSTDSVQKAALDLKASAQKRPLLESIFAPRSLLERFSLTPIRAVLTLLFSSAVFIALMILTRNAARLYYLSPTNNPLIGGGAFIASLAVLVLVGYASAKVFFRSSLDLLVLSACSAFSFLPVVAFSVVSYSPAASSLLISSRVVYTVLLVFFQTWSATILGAGISLASGVRIEKSILASLVVLYATMVLVFFQGNLI